VRPHAREPRQHVLELRELHLHARLAQPGARGEDVEDELRAIHHARARRVLDVLPLRGAQLVVEDEERRAITLDALLELLDLPLAEIGRRVRPVELLRERADDLGARRVGEALELEQVLIEMVLRARALERRADEERALDRRRERDDVACDGMTPWVLSVNLELLSALGHRLSALGSRQ